MLQALLREPSTKILYGLAHNVREPEGNIFDTGKINVGTQIYIIIKEVSLEMAKAAHQSGLLKFNFITNLTERAFCLENIANILNKWHFGLSTCRCQEPQDSIDHI